jgi:hypothetical protein
MNFDRHTCQQYRLSLPFAPMEGIKASASPKDYAREVVPDMMRSERRGKPELAGQLPLF